MSTLNHLITRCNPFYQHKKEIVFSIEDITHGDKDFLFSYDYHTGGQVAMLKWAKGSKSRSGSGSGARGSLAELRRASARLLRRKDSSSKVKNSLTPVSSTSTLPVDEAHDPVTTAAVPLSSTAFEGVIRQATVRRMSTLRQNNKHNHTHDLTNVPDERKHQSDTLGDCQSDTSSVYMQLDKIPVAVQSEKNKRKALEDISNQGYRQIIDSLQQELADIDVDSPPEHIAFTDSPPDDLHRPQPVRHTSPQSHLTLGGRGEFSNEELSRPLPPLGFHFSTSPAKKTCHTVTGQHVHLMNCPPRTLASPSNSASLRSAFSGSKKSRSHKTVTFASGEPRVLPVVFETDREDNNQTEEEAEQPGGEDAVVPSGFVNVPCSRRGLCDVDLDKLEEDLDKTEIVTEVKEGRLTPEGHEWQPSYVNLEDQEIAPVLLASSRPADESHDFWKPQTVHMQSPLYDSPRTDENHQLQFDLQLRYPIPLAAARHSISNSSGSDTQDSGVAELAQQGPASRAASASPFGVAAEVTALALQPAFNTLPRAEKTSQWANYPPVYDNTDPHYLSTTSSSMTPSTVSRFGTIDNQLNSDHLYCNMAPVDPRPLLPPRVSRRCTSLLDLSARGEDAAYENVHVSPVARPSVLHSRTRSLRTSGDFTPLALNMTATPDLWEKKPIRNRREVLSVERSLRLERLLLDNYMDSYEPSDWSTEAILSETVRDIDALSLSEETVTLKQSPVREKKQCACKPVCSKCGLPEISAARPVLLVDGPAYVSATSVQPLPVKKSQDNTSSLKRSNSKLSAAENPLYMAYNDLSKLVDMENDHANSDYFSDGCETWNSHKARVHNQPASIPSQPSTPPKRNRKLGPSSSRIWKQRGRTISTPNKKKPKARRKKRNNSSHYSSVNNTSALLERSLASIRSGGQTKRTVKKPKAKDVLQGKGQLQLSIYLNSGLLTIHIISGRNLKSISNQPCNTYVKVALIPDREERTFCRTSLIKNDNHPWFDQKFSFEFLSADLYKRLVISVWNRDIKRNRSEFLGCMSFSVSHVIRKDACGWYRLLTANVGRQQHFAVKKINEPVVDMEEDLVVVDDSQVPDEDESPAFNPKLEEENSQIKGRTPYTVSINLRKSSRGFGFSVTWTHPPRIERVEPGMPADLAGLCVGDYIIFVGNRNVVKMDENEVLQLIQSAGDSLHLEVYRKKSSRARLAPSTALPARTERAPIHPETKKLTVAFNQSIGGGILV